MDDNAQLRRYSKHAFGSDMNICVHHRTLLAQSTLNWLVFDFELDGVAEDWQGVQLGAPDTRLPDHLWEQTTHSPRRGHYQPMGPRARMTRPEGSGGGQQPAGMVEAPDHNATLAMADAEWAIHLDEEADNII